MSNLYVEELNRVKNQQAHLASEIGDQWRTPDWLFLALDKLYGPLVVDLFTDGQNSKCPVYFTADDNALKQDWLLALNRATKDCRLCDGTGLFYGDPDLGRCACRQPGAAKCFANPPYSIKRATRGRKADHITGMSHIMEKAYAEHLDGVPSVWLVKSATSESWWPDELASKIVHIKGRIGFEAPHWYRPDEMAGSISGAGFGASVVIFNGEHRVQSREEYISREKLMDIGMPLAKVSAEARQSWVSQWDDL